MICFNQHFKNEIRVTYQFSERIFFDIFISEDLRSLRWLLFLLHLNHLLLLLSSWSLRLACANHGGCTTSTHNQVWVASGGSRGLAKHRTAEGNFSWKCRHCEKNIDIVCVENVNQVAVHFINLKVISFEIRDTHIHIMAEGKSFHEEHGVAQLFRVLQRDISLLIKTYRFFFPSNIDDLLIHRRNKSVLGHYNYRVWCRCENLYWIKSDVILSLLLTKYATCALLVTFLMVSWEKSVP